MNFGRLLATGPLFALFGASYSESLRASCNAGQLDAAFGPAASNGFVQVSPFLWGSAISGGIEGVAIDAAGAIVSVNPTGMDSAGNVTAGIARTLKGGNPDQQFAGVGFAMPAGRAALRPSCSHGVRRASASMGQRLTTPA